MPSKVWDFFAKNNQGLATCNLCSAAYKFQATTSLMKHLEKKHPQVLEEKESSSSCSKVSDFFNKKNIDSNREAFCTNLLLRGIATGHCSLRIVENKHMKQLFHHLGFNLPSRRQCTRLILAQGEELIKKNVRKLEKAAQISLSLDCWTAKNARVSLLCIAAHVIMPGSTSRENFVLNIIPLSGEQHTAEYIENKLVQVIPILELSKSNRLTVDGATNLKKMCEIMEKSRNVCAAHRMNTVVQLLYEDDNINSVLRKVRLLTSNVKRSHQNRELFKKICDDLGIFYLEPLTDIKTRWSSTYLMVKTFFKIKAAFDVYCVKKKIGLLTTAEYESLRILNMVLDPFFEATAQVCNSYESVSVVIPIYRMIILSIEKNLESVFGEMRDLLTSLKKRCEQYFQPTVDDDFYRHATLLDPRWSYQQNLFDDNEWTMIRKTFLARHGSSPIDTDFAEKENVSSCWDVLGSIKTTVDRNLEVEIDEFKAELGRFRPSVKTNPSAWWDLHTGVYMKLTEIAKEYMVVPAASIDCERLFSIAGVLYNNQRRSRLHGETAKSLLLLATSDADVRDIYWSEKVDLMKENYENESSSSNSELSEEEIILGESASEFSVEL